MEYCHPIHTRALDNKQRMLLIHEEAFLEAWRLPFGQLFDSRAVSLCKDLRSWAIIQLMDKATVTLGNYERLIKILLENLRKGGISGSSVLPNLDADSEWLRVRSELRMQIQERIRDQLESLQTSL